MPCFLYVRETYVFLAFLVLSIPNPCNGLHTRSTIAALFQLPEDFFRCQLSALPHVLLYHANVRSSKLHVKELEGRSPREAHPARLPAREDPAASAHQPRSSDRPVYLVPQRPCTLSHSRERYLGTL